MTREEIYLAALLHDIGKFYQRADEKGSDQSNVLSNEVKKLKDIICPSNIKGFSHKHVLWTAQFFEDHKELFGNVLRKSECGNVDQLLKLAAKHHNPETIYERIIQKADHYSASMDRTNETAWKDAEVESNKDWNAFKKTRMRSVFSLISNKNSDSNNIDQNAIPEIPFCSLNINREYISYDYNSEENYSKLWKFFIKDIEKLRESNITILSETLGFILEKYTSRIPASTVNFPDVSLYDHLKISAAFAISLFDFITENGCSDLPSHEQNPFLLVGGDLSGIQKFLYSIAAHGAAKNLKGRSFYLQMLIDSIVTKLLQLLKLPGSCVIYKSGGNFYLLVPNTEKTKSIINNYIKEVEHKLFKYHSTQLYLVVDFVEFGEKIIFDDIGLIWNKLAEKINFRKRKKFISIIKGNYNQIFGKDVISIDNKLGRDYITGYPIEKGEKTIKLDPDNGNSIVKEYTYKQIELGKILKDTEYWVISFEQIPYWNEIFSFDPVEIGCFNYFINNQQLYLLKKELKGSSDNLMVRRFNFIDFLDNVSLGFNNVYGFVFYAGNDYPKDNNDLPKTFEELAGIEFKDNGKKERSFSPNLVRLGILRMDVDNLGSIFRDGIKKSFRSFSRYACLSRNLDLFFSGYLNTLWNSENEFKQYTQIIYAGGDDLFIVGKWDTLVKFAIKIYDDFKTWTCNNDNISISGGMSLVTPKFPILKAAEYSELEEKNAKEHICNGIMKDSFSVFNYAFNWRKEFKEFIKIKDELKELLASNDLPSSFVSNIFNIMCRAYPDNYELLSDEEKNLADLFKIRSKWLLAYNLKRASARNADKEEVRKLYDEWSKNIFINKIEKIPYTEYTALQILAIAVRWADFEIRSNINK